MCTAPPPPPPPLPYPTPRFCSHVFTYRSSPVIYPCWVSGSPRRCGGQGDLTAGFLGLFSHWACYAEREKRSKGKEREEKGEGRKGMDTDSAGSHQDSGSSVADAGTQTAREALEKVQAQYNQLPPTIVVRSRH